MRPSDELERLFQIAWDDWFAWGYFDTEKFLDWLFKQDMDMLGYAFFYFDALPNLEASDLGCEFVEYAMTHYELTRGYFSEN